MVNIFNDDYKNVIKEINNVDLIITDPPYLHEKGGRGKMLLGESLDRNEFNMKELGDFGKDEIYEFLNLTKPLMKKPQWYIFCSEKQLAYYLNWCVENKFKYNLLTWNKPLSVMNRERYSTNIEYIVRIYSSGCALNKLDLNLYSEKSKYYSKYKTYNQIRGKEKLHPSQKPIAMISEIIELSSNLNQVIFDPFMGSGSIGISAIENNRKFIGIELDENYYNVAKNRLGNITIVT
ncbi:DNA-methyltransferase [Terrisporobacter sp.]|uniref:DNA-methyltransferase n=1 Tax=Terrisporobacter sp. TaxID=1965305 RepID=UPI00289ED472|nr:site-specific DNA-methyltransferase [Terrisporobacter sp.]